jgi:hypothetical protein
MREKISECKETSMAAKRILIAIVLLAWVSLACESLVPAPGGENQQTQKKPGPTSQASAQQGAGGFPGCEFLPADIPFLQDAFGAEQVQGWCAYKTHKDYAAAVSFYRVQLPANGWKEFRATHAQGELGSDSHFYLEKSGRKLSVGILDMSGLGAKEIVVSLYPEHWIDQPCNGTVDLPTPADVPLAANMIDLCVEEYPGAAAGEAYYNFQYTTVESFEAVEQFYRTETLKAGWTLERERTQQAALELIFKKAGRTMTVPAAEDKFAEAPLGTLSIRIVPAKEYGDTDVTIRIDNSP